MVTNRIQNPMRFAQRLHIGEPHDGPPQSLDIHLSVMVVQHDLVALMNATVQFDHQPQGFTGEVGIASAYRMLTAELQPVASAIAQKSPDSALRQTRGFPQPSRPIRSLLSRHAPSFPSP